VAFRGRARSQIGGVAERSHAAAVFDPAPTSLSAPTYHVRRPSNPLLYKWTDADIENPKDPQTRQAIERDPTILPSVKTKVLEELVSVRRLRDSFESVSGWQIERLIRLDRV
jgi:hypothetical protein